MELKKLENTVKLLPLNFQLRNYLERNITVTLLKQLSYLIKHRIK